MGTVGTVAEVHWVSNQLNRSIIPGNSRWIEVIPGGDRGVDAKLFKKGGSETWGSKGGGSFLLPTSGGSKGGGAFLFPTSGGKGKGGGKGKVGDHSDEDPPGSGRVFVRGFDFGTSDEQLEGYMSQVGPIHKVHWVNKGNAVVVYKNMVSATQAVATLDNTTIPGNSRYINVTPRN